MSDLAAFGVAELQKKLRAREISPPEILRAVNDRIERLDDDLGAYLSRDFETALAEAETADVNLPLGGIPIAIKDLINVSGQPCTAGSRILQGYRAPYDATVIARLRGVGAIPFGRLNMDEFAMGSSGENSSVRATRNPWARDRVPGGSSSGAAAAVAAGTAIAALGSDTGGSIRQPAAMCGVVGVKPSYGRVSRYGLTAFSSSLDQIGPLTKTVTDAALLLEVIAGHDAKDSTSVKAPVPHFTASLARGLRGLRLGLPREYVSDGIDPAVRRAFDEAVACLTTLGAEIVEVSLPHTEQSISVYYLIATAEASANLARFDGIRYGRQTKEISEIANFYERTRSEGFGTEVKRRIILGTYVLSAGYYDAYYRRAQKVRELIRRDFTDAFAQVDALISPTTPTPAFRLGEKVSDPLQMYLADIFTNAANLAGICGLSLPCGFSEERLPLGLQILAPALAEELLLQIGFAYEQATAWHEMRPALTS